MADGKLGVLVERLELCRHPVGGPRAVGHGLEELACGWVVEVEGAGGVGCEAGRYMEEEGRPQIREKGSSMSHLFV